MKELSDALFSSASDGDADKDEWQTPLWLFERVQKHFGIVFDLDAAASDSNHLCANYFTKERSALTLPWDGEHVWCNPPYSLLKKFTEAMAQSADRNDFDSSVFLIPARTDTVAFHKLADIASDILFLKGRIKFVGAEHGAPFPSAIVRVLAEGKYSEPKVRFVDWRPPKP